MNEDAVNPADIAAPDANVAPVEENVAAPSPAVTDADENEVVRAAKGVTKRIDELTRLRRDAERDRDHWRELALRQPTQPKVETSTPVRAQRRWLTSDTTKSSSSPMCSTRQRSAPPKRPSRR
jgi:hypothetical protein